MRSVNRRVVGILVALLPLAPAIAAAQSTIAGVVRDATGAVLPGVSVEAASEALIERTRSAVTNADGRYAIVDLRPGTYTVTFTLSGFNTVAQTDIIVPANTAVPINADLKIGTISETIAVAAASPVVDVQNIGRVQVMNREMIDNIPNARNIQAMGSLVPGVRLTTPEVGGTQQTEQTYMTVHGNSQAHTAVTHGRPGRAYQPPRRRDAELHRQPADRRSDLQDQRRRRGQLARRRQPEHHSARTAAIPSVGRATSAAAAATGRVPT